MNLKGKAIMDDQVDISLIGSADAIPKTKVARHRQVILNKLQELDVLKKALDDHMQELNKFFNWESVEKSERNPKRIGNDK